MSCYERSQFALITAVFKMPYHQFLTTGYFDVFRNSLTEDEYEAFNMTENEFINVVCFMPMHKFPEDNGLSVVYVSFSDDDDVYITCNDDFGDDPKIFRIVL